MTALPRCPVLRKWMRSPTVARSSWSSAVRRRPRGRWRRRRWPSLMRRGFCSARPTSSQPDRPQALRAGRSVDRLDAGAAVARGDFALGSGDAAFRPRQGLSGHERLRKGVPSHYDEGNRLKRSTYSYDADANERRMASMAEVFSDSARQREARTWARVRTCPCSSSACPDPAHRWSSRSSRRIPHGPAQAKTQAASDPDRRGSRVPKRRSPTLPAARNLGRSTRPISASSKPMSSGRRHAWWNKMPSNFLACGHDPLAHPSGRAHHPHCRRNAVDTCLSCYTKLFARRAGIRLRSNRTRALPLRLPGAHGALAINSAGVTLSRSRLRGGR